MEKKMKLMKRLNKLITADAHAVLDSIEDPHALLKQAMRDMSSVIEEDELALKQISINIEQLKQQAQLFEKEQNKYKQDLELCFEIKNDELARTVVKKKLYLLQRIGLNQNNIQSAIDRHKQQEIQLASNQEQYLLIAQQAEVLLAEVTSPRKRNQINKDVLFHHVITEDDIDMALLNEKAHRVDS